MVGGMEGEEFSRGQLSGGLISSGAVILRSNCPSSGRNHPWDNYLGGNFPQGYLSGKQNFIFLLSFFRLEKLFVLENQFNAFWPQKGMLKLILRIFRVTLKFSIAIVSRFSEFAEAAWENTFFTEQNRAGLQNAIGLKITKCGRAISRIAIAFGLQSATKILKLHCKVRWDY